MNANDEKLAQHKAQAKLPTVFYEPKFEWSFLHPRYWGIWLLMLLLAVFAILPGRARRAIGAGLGDLFYKFNKKTPPYRFGKYKNVLSRTHRRRAL